jgi:NTE family protein
MDADVVSEPTVSPVRRRPQRARPTLSTSQGDGAHGVFTWGVAGRVLEDDRSGFDGISATSAGAMNAAVFASRKAAGNRQVYRRCDHQNGRDLCVAASTNRQLTR